MQWLIQMPDFIYIQRHLTKLLRKKKRGYELLAHPVVLDRQPKDIGLDELGTNIKHMVIFCVTWNVEKCKSAGDPQVGEEWEPIERGKNMGLA